MKEYFNAGDRVSGTVTSYYYGLPGRIIKLSPIQYGNFPRYVVKLEGIDKLISLSADHMKELPESE